MTNPFVIHMLLAILAFWTTVYAEPSIAADTSIEVIAHPSVQTEELTLKELRSVFTMKRTLWSNGEPIKVFVLENDNKLHKQFCMEVLGAFPRQLESVWYRLVYSGTGKAPVKVKSEKALVKLVSETPGAIGYINTEQISEDVEKIAIIK